MISIAFLIMSFYSPDVAYDSTKIACHSSSECGKGECWTGICEPYGFCTAYYTCV
jgi:hypothetical protein